ncbi:High-affinity branched-chain amino acid transport ATP-binding protein LivF [Marinovum algicola]|uniref:Amino acid/amide ABC transporter ATP-binding protein 2, HAAT family (TC 3.A.1.4.-) n=1 Tax=Marinovum algicola TaxID=42444 RepID=A0A975WBV2_9RHOB|nr:ABC transporter ATP-binding protein [Marinovum algicola]SEJ82956.1 amino acid/amide ABC transporter ATP-binding protein 2, HAAT family (TC 3.A.1.4.-) [Marinovum algicola]SLN62658.1 High-affinity branched-chain amino acid transport ATP-binding protein LivF [Marinovum algicola]
MLEIRDLNAWYGESHVLHGLDMDIPEGKVVTLLGRNGAGKTTMMRTIMGLMGKTTGTLTYQGVDLLKLRPDQIARRGIALCPEDRAIFPSLSVQENLFLPPIIAKGGMEIDHIYKLFPNIRERASSRGTQLSGGEQQMLAIARILRTGARFLLLDEPTEGLAPVIVQQIARTIKEIKALGYTILLVEQNARFVEDLADIHYLIENGAIVDRMEAAEFAANIDRVDKLLGV